MTMAEEIKDVVQSDSISRRKKKSIQAERGLHYDDADLATQTLELQDSNNRVFALREDTPTGIRKSSCNKIITSHYTFLSFVPVNMFEQFFYRPVNLYFISLVPLQMWEETTTSRGMPTVLSPLTFVIVVAAIKDAIEDYRRHKSDRLENNRVVIRATNGGQKKIPWTEVQVGDTVLLKNHDLIPADVILLDTSDQSACAYVETANLDGETNLKVKAAPSRCMTYQESDKKTVRDNNAPEKSLEFWDKVTGNFECQQPDGSLYTYQGVLKLDDPVASIPFNAQNLMLRGCKLRNTTWAVCKVVYTGMDTKIQRNSTNKAPKKITLVERVTFRVLICFFIMQCIFCTIGAAASAVFETSDVEIGMHLYLNLDNKGTIDESFIKLFVIRFLTFILIFANFIPISLMVTMNMVKFGQALFIQYDKSLTYKGQNTVPRTSDLNEELGQVDSIFSDKTGTLTQNLMEFRRCCVQGISYGQGLTEIRRQVLIRSGKPVPPEPQPMAGGKITPCVNFYDPELEKNLKDAEKRLELFEFFLHVAINHTVNVEKVGDDFTYSASSPDEGALVYGARHFDFMYLDRQAEMITLSCPGYPNIKAEVLVSIDFSSLRKRSSTIVRFFHPIKQRNVIMLYTKGADSIIEARLSRQQREGDSWKKCNEIMQQYALDGLRTLVFAGRELPEKEFSDWYEQYDSASNAMTDRTKKMELVAELIEANLELHAGTGVEDRLQDEVGNTLEMLQQAGLKIWMLTGDKVETAINIGIATGLIQPHYEEGEMAVFDWDALAKKKEQVSKEVSREAFQHLKQRSRQDPFDADAVMSSLDTSGLLNASREIVESITLDARGESEKTRKKELAVNDFFTDCLVRARKDVNSIKAIVIDGPSLAVMLERPQEFVDFTSNCHSVLCCRVSPDQKGQVVRLMKTLGGRITLAVGDGANDCNMIRSAHVGVGIRGEEGLQAFNVCDYGIAQFRFLQGLLLVHGRYCYRRMSILVMYMFYKNVLVVVPQFLLGFVNQFSGMRLYLDLMYQSYNIVFTSFPILVFGMMDKDTSKENCYRYPQLYKLGVANYYLNFKNILMFVLLGFWHSFVVYYVPYGALAFSSGVVDGTGQVADLWVLGTMIMILEVVIANAKLIVEGSTINRASYFTFFLSAGFFIMFSMFTNFVADLPFGGFEAYGVTMRLFQTSISFLVILLSLVAALLPDVLFKIAQRTYFPTPVHKLEDAEPLLSKMNPRNDP